MANQKKKITANIRKQSWGNRLYTGEISYGVVKYRWRFYLVSIILCILCGFAIFINGLHLGIDFSGGSQFTVSNISMQADEYTSAATETVTKYLPDSEPAISSIGDNSIRIQTGVIDDQETVVKLRDDLASKFSVGEEQVSSTTIGPTWGASVGFSALRGLGLFLLFAAIFMTFYFRSWQMAVSGIIALIHDLVITVGVYALVGWEITPASVIGFLTILGYSMYDTVVVFDKVRENTHSFQMQSRVNYADLANLAVNQTLVRSINTTVVALLPIGSILFFGAFFMGAGTLRDIALALFVGMAVGAYSSIFLATPLEVSLRKFDKRVQENNKKVEATRLELASKLDANGQDSSDAGLESAKLLPGKRLANQVQPTRKLSKRRKK